MTLSHKVIGCKTNLEPLRLPRGTADSRGKRWINSPMTDQYGEDDRRLDLGNRMTTARLNRVIQRLREAAALNGAGGLADADLLDLFLLRRDEAAFAELVRRHGPMVLGVCRRVLRNADDADDAFQATFLILVRRAASVRPRCQVGAWLHGVAYRTALEARRAAAKRVLKEASAMPRTEPPEDVWAELRPVLDRELARLPEKYRVPLLACDLEGKTRKEAASQLGWAEGTVASRLSRARALLTRRMTRHGLALSGAAALAESARTACVPPALAQSTIKAAMGLAAGRAAAAGLVSAKVAALMQGVMRAVLYTKLKIAAAVLAALAATGVGLGALTHYLSAAAPPRNEVAQQGDAGKADAPKGDAAPAPAPEPWGTVEGRVLWDGGDAPAPASVVMDKDREACLKNGPIYKTDYVVNPKNKGVRWAVVWLVDADDYRRAPPVHPVLKEVTQTEVVLDQPCCQFEPHIVCMRAGQTLIARNSGTVPHNTKIDSPGGNPSVNPLIPAGASLPIPGWRAESAPSLVACNIHPWMTAYIRVFDHPYFAVTDGDGRFKMEKAPAGKFHIVAWQESVGYLDKGLKKGDPIEIKPGGVAEVDFTVKPNP
jgi:RNA polymerase sigma factor (sigma-70 family)